MNMISGRIGVVKAVAMMSVYSLVLILKRVVGPINLILVLILSINDLFARGGVNMCNVECSPGFCKLGFWI